MLDAAAGVGAVVRSSLLEVLRTIVRGQKAGNEHKAQYLLTTEYLDHVHLLLVA